MKRHTMERAAALLLAALLTVSLMGCGGGEEKPAAAAAGTQSTYDPLVLSCSEARYEAPARYLYDPEGRVVRKIQEQWDRVTEYTYHSGGNLETERVYDGGILTETREYDTRGNLLRTLQGEERSCAETYTYLYDSQDRLTEKTRLCGSDALEKWKYTYQADGGYCVEHADYIPGNQEWILHCHSLETYSSQGLLLQSEKDMDCMTQVSSLYRVLLDEQGNISRTRQENTYDGVYSMTEFYYENSYDAEGRLIGSDCFYTFQEILPYGTETQRILKEYRYSVSHTYDGSGRKLRERTEYAEGGYVTENTWTYDAEGNLLSYTGLDEYGSEVSEVFAYAPLSTVLLSQ